MKSYSISSLLLLSLILSLGSSREDLIFKEYRSKEFTFEGHEAKIIFPENRNPNGYWIWRARFWGHEPQVDKALLDMGFHLVYIEVADMFGGPAAVALWNKFYEHCLQNYDLNPRVVLEGMSRGGLMIYNWASQNTDKVFCIYADAPVCDIKSWPGGMLQGPGNPESWKICLEAYGLDTITVKEFKGIPINNCVRIAEAGIPVIHVFGDADTIVPYGENTALLAENFRAAGGNITLIRKEGIGHHPHSLEDPAPIVEFILESVDYRE